MTYTMHLKMYFNFFFYKILCHISFCTLDKDLGGAQGGFPSHVN